LYDIPARSANASWLNPCLSRSSRNRFNRIASVLLATWQAFAFALYTNTPLLVVLRRFQTVEQNQSLRMSRSNIPPRGRLIEYGEAHSPFQKLIDSQRKHCGLSGGELAERIGVSQSTLWIWLHNLNGFPDPKSFNSEHVRRLGEVLEISETEIKGAIDASRHVDTPREPPMSHHTFDAFGRFIEILDNDKRQTMPKSYVLNVAKNLYRGAK
jgi:transcriptional regulator with XRE-family HTH domain